MTIPFVSVICPIYNEECYIKICVESMLNQDYPNDRLEILFVDGMSNDNTRNILSFYLEQYPFIRLLDNIHKTVPFALNIGIRASVGDVIIRIDGHSVFPNNYISTLVKYLYELDAYNVGCSCITEVKNITPKSMAIKEVLSNKFGVGNSLFRLGVSDVKEVDTVPFGCWKRDVFDKVGYFDERLTRNQDIEFNKRIKRHGGKIYLVPDISCIYYARENFKSLFENNYANGKWNILAVYYSHNVGSLSLRHFIPLTFVLSIIVSALFSVFIPFCAYVLLLILLVYVFFVLAMSLFLSHTKKLNCLYLFCAFAVLHISYGLGSFIGLFRFDALK